MRHNKKFNHLGRTAPHRKAMLANMATSLILHKRINTTVAKAKALRKYVEPLITKSKLDNTHARRVVFSYLQDKEASKVLFNEISEKVMDRAGGYTRIIKLGNRLGDNAEMAMIELVDYNNLYGKEEKSESRTGSRRGRRRGGKKSGGGAQAKDSTQEQKSGGSEAADTSQMKASGQQQTETESKEQEKAAGTTKTKGGKEEPAEKASSEDQSADQSSSVSGKDESKAEDEGKNTDNDENKSGEDNQKNKE